MSVDSLIMFSGAFVAILLQLGFPQSWDRVLLAIAGVLILALGIVVRRRGLMPRQRPGNGEVFSRSMPGQDILPPRHDEVA